jgi:hypothetical protein
MVGVVEGAVLLGVVCIVESVVAEGVVGIVGGVVLGVIAGVGVGVVRVVRGVVFFPNISIFVTEPCRRTRTLPKAIIGRLRTG